MVILTKSKKDVILLQTKAHIKANAKYNLKTYKNLQIQVKKEEAATIDDFVKKWKLAKLALLLTLAITLLH